MTTNTDIAVVEQALEELSRQEHHRRQTRPGYFEVAITDNDQPFLARWMAGNEEEIWRTSENYVELEDAVHAIALIPGGCAWLLSYTPRLVDERSGS